MLCNKKEIQKCVNEVLAYSQNVPISAINTDRLINSWYDAKHQFIKALGGPIWESEAPISFELNQEARESRLDSFIGDIAEHSCDLAEFFEANRAGFFENKTVVAYRSSRTDALIPAGMRIGKALHRYFDGEVGDEYVEFVRNEMSRIIQENKVTGTLCLSVHPLDFLSSSENQHNWRSCHALDGDYRAGNLSYMTDNCTIMAYLKSEGDVALPRFPESVPWNNKKWRCLFFFDHNNKLVYEGRQYPYSISSIFPIITDVFYQMKFFTDSRRYCMDAWREYVFTDFSIGNKQYETQRHLYAPGHGIFHLKDVVKDHDYSYHFNDLLKSSFYLPRVYDYHQDYFGSAVRFKHPMTVGGYTYCICCGETHVADSNTMMCDRCRSKYDDEYYEEDCDGEYCYICGNQVDADDVVYMEGMYPYCPDCFEQTNVATCQTCGQPVDTDNPYQSRQFFNRDTGACRCGPCNERHQNELAPFVRVFYDDPFGF